MTSLVFYIQSDHIILSADTLAVDFAGRPALLCSKITHIPHLNTLIAGTGIGGFSNEWAFKVATGMVVSCIDHLNYHTPEALRELWRGYQARENLPDSLTTTVYQFGMDASNEEVKAYAYRSSNDFLSEPIGYGLWVKPECDKSFDDHPLRTTPLIMERQIELENQKEIGQRLFIGGEITTYALDKDGCNFVKLYKFDSYDQDVKSIYDNFNKK